MRLTEKVALVTGGAGGIGGAIARRFAAEGARIAIVDRNDARPVIDQIAKAGGTARGFRADLRKVSECRRVAKEVGDAFGRIDILANVAGVFIGQSLEETTEEAFDEQMAVNIKGPLFLTQAVLPYMQRQGAGRVICVNSPCGYHGFPGCSAYSASKGALIGFMRAAMTELAPQRININGIAPGNTRTEINRSLWEQEGFDETLRRCTPGDVGYLDPDDLAGTAVFLASDDSTYVHGLNVAVDAGLSEGLAIGVMSLKAPPTAAE